MQSYSVDDVSPLAPNFARAAISTREDTSLHYSQSDKMFTGGVTVRRDGVGVTHFVGLCLVAIRAELWCLGGLYPNLSKFGTGV